MDHNIKIQPLKSIKYTKKQLKDWMIQASLKSKLLEYAFGMYELCDSIIQYSTITFSSIVTFLLIFNRDHEIEELSVIIETLSVIITILTGFKKASSIEKKIGDLLFFSKQFEMIAFDLNTILHSKDLKHADNFGDEYYEKLKKLKLSSPTIPVFIKKWFLVAAEKNKDSAIPNIFVSENLDVDDLEEKEHDCDLFDDFGNEQKTICNNFKNFKIRKIPTNTTNWMKYRLNNDTPA
jgi:hypothetical protein